MSTTIWAGVVGEIKQYGSLELLGSVVVISVDRKNKIITVRSDNAREA